MTTLSSWLHSARTVLEGAGVDSAQADAELIAAHVLGGGRGEVSALAIGGRACSAAELEQLDALLARRERREPLQHLTGIAAFRHLELEVGPGVFVPRPETEVVVQIGIDALATSTSEPPTAVDLGSGSGAIALSLATEVPSSRVWAVELSAEAREWTARNIARYGEGRVELVAGDMADCLPELNHEVDVVVSNPPYIPDVAIPKDPEAAHFDPKLALYGGPDGLDLVRQLHVTARRLLRPGGLLVIEHGEFQAQQIGEILRSAEWSDVTHHRDLTGRDRATSAIAPSEPNLRE
ncbi:MAG TPA: peptide chain release factor N(5)-glutamine methyltransferase [Microbacteriaceae bacterium]|nr:peptide chain release factor N(5)-glutamine methyltransferase [Microbacteriaceae bacterium]